MTSLTSLRARLTAAGILFAVLAVALTSWIIARTATTDLVGDVDARLDAQSIVLSELTSYAVFAGTWSDVETLVDPLAADFEVRIALTDLEGRVLADSDPSVEFPTVAAAVIDPTNPLFSTELSEAGLAETEAIAEFVSVCLARAGVPHTVEIDEFGITNVFVDYRNGSDFEIEERCFDEAFEQLDPAAFEDLQFDVFAEPALLFLGSGPVPSLDTGALLAVAAVVIVVLVIGAAWFASRLTRPLNSLIDATRSVRGGDLSTRVEVSDDSEIGELAGAFNEMAGALEQSRDRRRQFTTDVAHELRTPLANITGHVEALVDGVEQPDENVLGVIRHEVYRLGGLVDDLQQLSLADERALTMDRIPLVVDDIIDQVVSAHRHRAETDGVTLISTGQAPSPLDLDPRRIRQVVDNLVSNAVRHAPTGSDVEITLDQSEAATTISVRDHGDGIPPEFLPNVFDRFARADQARSRATGGTGLGLAITRELVRAHGGSVTAANAADGGALFTVTLPGPDPA